MVYEFSTKTMTPIKIDGKTFDVYCIKSKDIQKGGFIYELSNRMNKKNRELQRRFAEEQKRIEKLMELGQSYNVPDDEFEYEEMLDGASARMIIEYQQEIVKHYTSMSEEEVEDLPMLVLKRISDYIERGVMDDAEAADDSKNESAGENPRSQEQMPDQAKQTTAI